MGLKLELSMFLTRRLLINRTAGRLTAIEQHSSSLLAVNLDHSRFMPASYLQHGCLLSSLVHLLI